MNIPDEVINGGTVDEKNNNTQAEEQKEDLNVSEQQNSNNNSSDSDGFEDLKSVLSEAEKPLFPERVLSSEQITIMPDVAEETDLETTKDHADSKTVPTIQVTLASEDLSATPVKQTTVAVPNIVVTLAETHESQGEDNAGSTESHVQALPAQALPSTNQMVSHQPSTLQEASTPTVQTAAISEVPSANSEVACSNLNSSAQQNSPNVHVEPTVLTASPTQSPSVESAPINAQAALPGETQPALSSTDIPVAPLQPTSRSASQEPILTDNTDGAQRFVPHGERIPMRPPANYQPDMNNMPLANGQGYYQQTPQQFQGQQFNPYHAQSTMPNGGWAPVGHMNGQSSSYQGYQNGYDPSQDNFNVPPPPIMHPQYNPTVDPNAQFPQTVPPQGQHNPSVQNQQMMQQPMQYNTNAGGNPPPPMQSQLPFNAPCFNCAQPLPMIQPQYPAPPPQSYASPVPHYNGQMGPSIQNQGYQQPVQGNNYPPQPNFGNKNWQNFGNNNRQQQYQGNKNNGTMNGGWQSGGSKKGNQKRSGYKNPRIDHQIHRRNKSSRQPGVSKNSRSLEGPPVYRDNMPRQNNQYQPGRNPPIPRQQFQDFVPQFFPSPMPYNSGYGPQFAQPPPRGNQQYHQNNYNNKKQNNWKQPQQGPPRQNRASKSTGPSSGSSSSPEVVAPTSANTPSTSQQVHANVGASTSRRRNTPARVAADDIPRAVQVEDIAQPAAPNVAVQAEADTPPLTPTAEVVVQSSPQPVIPSTRTVIEEGQNVQNSAAVLDNLPAAGGEETSQIAMFMNDVPTEQNENAVQSVEDGEDEVADDEEEEEDDSKEEFFDALETPQQVAEFIANSINGVQNEGTSAAPQNDQAKEKAREVRPNNALKRSRQRTRRRIKLSIKKTEAKKAAENALVAESSAPNNPEDVKENTATPKVPVIQKQVHLEELAAQVAALLYPTAFVTPIVPATISINAAPPSLQLNPSNLQGVMEAARHFTDERNLPEEPEQPAVNEDTGSSTEEQVESASDNSKSSEPTTSASAQSSNGVPRQPWKKLEPYQPPSVMIITPSAHATRSRTDPWNLTSQSDMASTSNSNQPGPSTPPREHRKKMNNPGEKKATFRKKMDKDDVLKFTNFKLD